MRQSLPVSQAAKRSSCHFGRMSAAGEPRPEKLQKEKFQMIARASIHPCKFRHERPQRVVTTKKGNRQEQALDALHRRSPIPELRFYFFAFSNRRLTSVQLTTFHQAAR